MQKLSSFENETPQTVLRWTVETFGDRAAVVTSLQPTGIATIHMLTTLFPQHEITALTLDTGLLFPETYALMDAVEARFPRLRLIRLQPALTVDEQNRHYGDKLWQSNPDRCCAMRKVVVLDAALRRYGAWMTGLRRDQSSARAATPIVKHDRRHDNVKIAPFATWTEAMVWTYIEAYDLPYNALHDRGYPSIGCAPCTQPVQSGFDDARAGRWQGHTKTECGIHDFNNGVLLAVGS